MVQNGAPLGNMVIKLGLDSSAFSDSLTGASRATKTAVKEMQAGFKTADAGGSKIKALTAKQEGLTKVIQAQKNELKYLGDAYQSTFDKQGNATSKTAKAAQKFNDAQASLAAYEAQLKTANAQIARLRVETEGLTGWLNKKGDQWIESGKKISQFGDNVQKVGSSLTKGVTMPLAVGSAAVIKAAIDWETAFTGVKKTNDEIRDSTGRVVYSYQDLEDGLRGLTKVLPASHTEIANVAEAAGQLGIQTDKVVGFTKTMIDLGESTNMSAETAATSLARFTNITGLAPDKVDRLGSSLVELGNNFATTESEITDMALRLAGAGTQIGMSESEILGFAAALSSVGVEAEAGGSAFSKVMVQMQLAVEKGTGSFEELKSAAQDQNVPWEELVLAVRDGGKALSNVSERMGYTSSELKKMYKEADKSKTSLENFSNVAGLTSEQFSQLFKDDPSAAIMKFVEGLSLAESQGTSAIKVLDDMDIKEVRLRDSLLRAANASGTFGDAIAASNKAFDENTALTEEAGKRYETTAAKIDFLKSEINEVAIDLGGPLVDALREGLQASKPLIQGLGDLAKKFNSLDREQQQNIIKWGLIAAAAGPALKIIGSGISVIGKAKTGVGLLSKGIVELAAKAAEKKALSSLATTVAGVGTAATSAAGVGAGGGGIAALGVSLSSLAVPAIIAVGAVAAVSVAVYAGIKAYEAHQLAGAKWGTEVTKEQDKVITNSYELKEKAVLYVEQYGDGVSGAAEKAKQANQEIVDSIQKVMDKELERKKKAAEELNDSAEQKKAEAYLAGKERINELEIKQAQKKVDSINAILDNASQNNRKLSDAERQYVMDNYKLLSQDQLKAAGFDKKERLAIETAYQQDLAKLTKEQMDKRQVTLQDGLESAEKTFEEQKKHLETIYEENPTALKASMDKLTKEYTQSTDTLITGIAKLFQAQGDDISKMEWYWQSYGYTTKEVLDLVNSSVENTSKNIEMFAKGTSEADMAWNAMALDPKTGSVKTNMAETLVEIAKTDNGWEQLQFMTKNADLETNAKEEVAIAMGMAGKWETMYLTDKLLTVDGDKAKMELFDSIDKLGMWNQYNADRKILGADNADAVWAILDSEEKLSKWNSIPAEQKTLIGDNTDIINKLLTSEAAMNTWDALDAKSKDLIANNEDLMSKIFASEETMSAWNGLPVQIKNLLTNNEDVLEKVAQGSLDLDLYQQNNPALKVLLGDSLNVKEASKLGESALDNFARNNPAAKTLAANDEASGPAANALNAVLRFAEQQDRTVTLKTIYESTHITRGDPYENPAYHAKGTNYHRKGPMVVNDQKGPLYEELVQFPNGFAFIPKGRDVFIPHAPSGTKVYTAAQTKKLVPKYKDGVGIPERSTLVQNLRNLQSARTVSSVNITNDNSKIESMLGRLLEVMSNFGEDLRSLQLVMDGKVVTSVVNERQNATNKMIAKARGRRQ